MTPGRGFVLFFGLTLLLLGGVVVTGKLARRRLHVTLVLSSLLSLGVTIYYAERLGELYDLDSAGLITPIHLTLAKLTVLCYLLPIGLGIATTRRRSLLPWHRRAAYFVLGATVLTTITGIWMILAADRVN